MEKFAKMAESGMIREGPEKISTEDRVSSQSYETNPPRPDFKPPWQERPETKWETPILHDGTPPWKHEPRIGEEPALGVKPMQASFTLPWKNTSNFSLTSSFLRKDTPPLSREIYPQPEYLLKNKEDGLRRETEVEKELKEKYPESEGYTIEKEVYLRDKDGNIVKDPVTGEARRIDFVVVKDGKVVDSIEVTSKTADKTEQSAKEDRIRENGGNYIKDSNGNLVEIPSDVKTHIERRD